jgi:alpha-tubulin suppressor-like RCC1 family protein
MIGRRVTVVVALALLCAGGPPAMARPVAPAIQDVALGFSHTCALTSTGVVECWGANESGELGDGTTTRRTQPVTVGGLDAPAAQVDAGGAGHTCALTTAGGVECWGRNRYGQLGDGTTTDRSSPVEVSGLQSGVTQIAVGGDHVCALTDTGAIWCWGHDDNGQLGDGTTANSSVPVHVTGLGGPAAVVSAGGDHTCALMPGGGAKCWGANGNGQAGDGTMTDHRSRWAERPMSAR